MIWPFKKSKPTEIVLGRGLTLIGHGLKNGRAFVLLRTVKVAGRIGTTPPEFRDVNWCTVTAKSGDVVIWLDGDVPQSGLATACSKALKLRKKAENGPV